MTKHIKETVNPPRGPDEFAFWKYHVDNTDKKEHPQGNENVFKGNTKRQPRLADDIDFMDVPPAEADITAEWVDELLANVKNVMRGYIPGDVRADLDESAAKKIWNWWHQTSPKDIAKKIKGASKKELMDIVNGVDPKSARRILSGPKLVEYNFAKKKLQKLIGGELNEDFTPGKFEIGGEEIDLSEEDSKILNKLYNSLSEDNQKKLKEKIVKDVETYEGILEFAKEKFSTD